MSERTHKIFAFFLLVILTLRVTKSAAQSATARSFNPNVIIGDYVYYIGLFQKVNWFRAVNFCAFQDMSLLAIESKEQNDALEKFLNNNNALKNQYWISANDLAIQDEFYWLGDGHPLSYTNWGANQSSIIPGIRSCVRTLSNFQWSVSNCLSKNYFICQQPVKPLCGIRNECQRRT